MNCKTSCANYKPVEVERPTDHPNRIFAEDLRVGMVIKQRGEGAWWTVAIILAKPEELRVEALCTIAGLEPRREMLVLASVGLKPYKAGHWHGDGTERQEVISWHPTAWCEEVT